MAMSVKVHFYHPTWERSNVYRTELTEPYTVRDLAEKLEKLAEGATVFNLRWRDDEKDLVVLKTDEDLRLAIDHVRTTGHSHLSLHADVKAKPAEAACGSSELASEVASAAAPGEGKVKRRTSTDFPMRDLPGGGQYCGYVRTTDKDGKTVEREMTVDEAQELMKMPTMPNVPSLFGGFEDVFGWPAFRRPQYPAIGYHRPLSLPYYF